MLSLFDFCTDISFISILVFFNRGLLRIKLMPQLKAFGFGVELGLDNVD